VNGEGRGASGKSRSATEASLGGYRATKMASTTWPATEPPGHAAEAPLRWTAALMALAAGLGRRNANREPRGEESAQRRTGDEALQTHRGRLL
jgi:hypothetical protein